MDIKKKVVDEFLTLAKISSPTFKERELAGYLKKRLTELGLEVFEDDAGKALQSETGNIIGVLRTPGKKKIMFNAHMDVVSPCENVEPIVEDGIIRTDGSTTLGSDDKAGIAAILTMLEYIKENDIEHPEIYTVFTVAEEGGCLGVAESDVDKYGIDYGFILDGFVEPGIVAYGEPALRMLEVTVKGKSGHLFFDAKEGVNAFKMATDAMAKIDLGIIDENTIANAVYEEGDSNIGVIPGNVKIGYIIASYDDDVLKREIENLQRAFKEVAQKYNGSVNIEEQFSIPKFILDDDSEYIRIIENAAKKSGLDFEKCRPVFITDAGTFNKLGVPTVVLGTGVKNAHSVREYIKIQHIVDNANLLIKMVPELGAMTD